MEATTLPEDLQIELSNGLGLFDYRKNHDLEKTKVNLLVNVVSFLKTGVKEVVGDDGAVQIDNQHFLIMKSGKCLMTEKISNTNNVYHSVLLFFSDKEVLDFLEKHKLYSIEQSKAKSFYAFKYDDFIHDFTKGLEKISTLPETVQRKLLRVKFEEIMLYLAYKNTPGFLNALVQSVDNKAARLMAVVDNNKYNKLSLEELAFLCSMSVSTFRRAFLKHYQETPMKWFKEKRLKHIAFILQTSEIRPIEVYERAGYDTFSNFVQAFKKHFGVTPKQYQAQA